MYCVKCGVELANSEKSCPLCGTKVICPEGLAREEAPSPYPAHPGKVTEGMSRIGFMFIITFLSAIAVTTSLICDLSLNSQINWSGYVVGGIGVWYVIFLLPMWFKKANPVIFTPIAFVGIGLFLLYISVKTDGKWFLSLGFPADAAMGLILTAAVTLRKYTRGGELYIYGGASILFGCFAVLIEYLVKITFGVKKMFVWSPYPFTGLFLIGMLLIIIGICKPLRESLKRKLFF